jgi:hypothetical protein
MADWQTADHLTDHVMRLGHKMGYRTVDEYDAGA